jgi:hypothetical protein
MRALAEKSVTLRAALVPMKREATAAAPKKRMPPDCESPQRTGSAPPQCRTGEARDGERPPPHTASRLFWAAGPASLP